MPVATVQTPLGPFIVVADDRSVTSAHWLRKGDAPVVPDDTPVLRDAAAQVLAYFAGSLSRFDLPLAPVGTPFQRAVWTALEEIPYGETRTYGAVAAAAGGSARAVGGACGRNPITLIVPCHRVVGANGRLTGYSGGNGIETKAALLAIECRGTPDRPFRRPHLYETGRTP